MNRARRKVHPRCPVTDTTGMAALWLMLIPALAFGQSGDPEAVRLERVDQGFEDVSPLAHSLRWIEPEYRQPRGFDSVYAVPGAPGVLMRRDGALRALFQRSEYVQTRFGTEALVPTGTIYSIGEPSAELLTSLAGGVTTTRSLASPGGITHDRAPASGGSRVSPLRVSNRYDPNAVSAAVHPLLADVPVSVWTSEPVRRRRVAALIGSIADPADSSPRR